MLTVLSNAQEELVSTSVVSLKLASVGHIHSQGKSTCSKELQYLQGCILLTGFNSLISN